MIFDLTSTLLTKYIPNADAIITIHTNKRTPAWHFADSDRMMLWMILFNIVNISDTRQPLLIISAEVFDTLVDGRCPFISFEFFFKIMLACFEYPKQRIFLNLL